MSSQRTNGPWSPPSEKERKKRHAATETCGAWDHVSFFLLHWILLRCCSLLTHSPSLGSPPSFLSGLQPHSLGLMRLIPPSLTRFSFCGVHSLNLGSHTHRTTLSLAIPNCSDGALRIMMTIPHALLNFHPNTSAPLIKSCRPCSNF